MGSEAAYLEYKCRRCGSIDKSTGTNARYAYPIMLSLIDDDIPMPEAIASGGVMPGMLDTHDCKDGGLGVSDFIGVSNWHH